MQDVEESGKLVRGDNRELVMASGGNDGREGGREACMFFAVPAQVSLECMQGMGSKEGVNVFKGRSEG